MFSAIQYFPYNNTYGATCIINNINCNTYTKFLEFVNASDYSHKSIVIIFQDKDWRYFADISEECRKALKSIVSLNEKEIN